MCVFLKNPKVTKPPFKFDFFCGESLMGIIYPSLPTNNDELGNSKQMKICISTPDIIGPVRNGGIGTAYAALADALVGAGHDVTILYLLGEYTENQSIKYWIHYYSIKGIMFIPFARQDTYVIENPGRSKKSYEVYLWFKDHGSDFDVIHFPEWLGYGYYSMLAKREGLAFHHTTFVVTTHSPYLWNKIGNHEILNSIEDLEIDFIERESVKLADYVISPSIYMVQWLSDQEWAFPKNVFIQPNILPSKLKRECYPEHGQSISEVVFFGRLETRKGLELFCTAVDRLLKVYRDKKVSVTFLGKIGIVNHMKSDTYILQRSASWEVPVSILSNKNRDEALEYLKEGGKIAVIASLSENSPYTVLECLGASIPFLTTDVGGIPELIYEEDRAGVCYAPNPNELAQKLLLALTDGMSSPKTSIDFAENEKIWVRWHESLIFSTTGDMQLDTANLPLVSVCITHFNRPAFLSQAVESLYAQDYPRFEVILVDDGSNQPETLAYLKQLELEFEQRKWKLIYQNNLYLGAARNTAAFYAQGDYLLFMDDDNYAKPNMITMFIQVAQKMKSDILTCSVDFFSGQDTPDANTKVIRRWVPLGGSVAIGAFRNCFGDANSLIRRDTFNSMGGFTEEYGIGNEDWEFFANAVLNGLSLYTITEGLFWYRRQNDSMSHSTNESANYLRSIRPYIDQASPHLKNLIMYMQGQYLEIHGKRTYPGSYFNQIDLYWNSTSWKLLRPFRNFVRFVQGRPKEQRPEPLTEQEAESFIKDIRQSTTWELTGPLRVIVRLFKGHSLLT